MSEALSSRNPEKRILDHRQYVKALSKSLSYNFQQQIQKIKTIHLKLNSKLQALNPEAVLKRGYSISRFVSDKRVIINSRDVKINDQIEIILSNGQLITRVEKING